MLTFANKGKIMPIINIKMMEGRSLEQKRLMADKVTQAVAESLGITKESVWISIDEMKPEHFSRAGILLIDKQK